MRKRLDEYFDLKKNVNRKETENFQKKLAMFHKRIGSLFDILTCKCRNFATFACSREKKVPFQAQQFLSDQRFARKMFIGSLTKRNKKHFKGKWKIKGALQLKLFFLSILRMVLNHLQHQNQVKNPIVKSSQVCFTNMQNESRHRWEMAKDLTVT